MGVGGVINAVSLTVNSFVLMWLGGYFLIIYRKRALELVTELLKSVFIPKRDSV